MSQREENMILTRKPTKGELVGKLREIADRLEIGDHTIHSVSVSRIQGANACTTIEFVEVEQDELVKANGDPQT